MILKKNYMICVWVVIICLIFIWIYNYFNIFIIIKWIDMILILFVDSHMDFNDFHDLYDSDSDFKGFHDVHYSYIDLMCVYMFGGFQFACLRFS